MSDRRPPTNGVTESYPGLDERLRRLVQPPPEDRLAEIARRAIIATSPTLRRRGRTPVLRRLAVAAAVAACVAGAWLIGDSLRQPGPSQPGGYTPEPWRSRETAYNDWVAEGFRPMWVCADDQEFIDTFRAAYHQGLLLGTLPPGTTALGLSYCNNISARTTCLLADTDGTPVVVFVDRVEADHPQPQPEGLYLHRRRIGRLVLYELSPLEHPAVLPWFINPDDGGS